MSKETVRVTKKKPSQVKAKKQERLTAEQEQDVLTRLSRKETLRHIQSIYGKELQKEISNLKKAFKAEEFLLKEGVWQLMS
jgi:hypothetical protein